MFETDEEQEMLYTLSVSLEYFEKEMERGKEFYLGSKKSNDYGAIAKMLKLTCDLVRAKLEENSL